MRKIGVGKNSWRLGGLVVLALFVIAVWQMVARSPYKFHPGHDHRLIKQSVVIDAEVEQVFLYLGNSGNAQNWSVFVDHIVPQNTDAIADGKLGSVRRCFEKSDETGKVWDEEILIVEPNLRRRLSCYNFQGFGLTTGPLLTEQIYETTEDGKCRLSFTLFPKSDDNGIWTTLKIHYGSYEVAGIFERNLANIKRINEANATQTPVYPISSYR